MDDSNQTFKVKFRINILKDHFLIPGKCRNGWTKYKTKCFKVFKEEVYYSKAKQICAENNATTISIQSLEENEFVANLTKKSAPKAVFLWIGAKRTSSGLREFVWENGDPFSYSNWDIGEPTDGAQNENYVQMFLGDGYWGDYIDKDNTTFICE
jgi:hypothetical protein